MHTIAVRLALAATTIGSLAFPAYAQEPTWMRGLDALLSAEVTSVSRKEQRLSDTTAAVYVLTRDEIRRSGMRTVPDLLRLVPGLHVAQIDANKWAVSSRGLSSRFAKQLLVMIDGRSVYSPYYAGVFWDSVDVPVDIIERIEVIRGPGASIWGANAVNGVINIITMTDVVRRETAISGGVGGTNFGTMVHGGRIGDMFGYQLFASATDHHALELPAGGNAGDAWRTRSAGGSFRGRLNPRDTLEGSARAFSGRADYVAGELTDLVPFTFVVQPIVATSDVWSASVRWTRQLTGGGHLQTEVWTDQWWRLDEGYDHTRRSTDLSFQYRTGVRRGNDIIAGGAFRRTTDTSHGTLWTRMTPDSDAHTIVSAFAQDEIAFAGKRGRVVVGSKLEHRDHIGWNVQPTARVHWRFSQNRSAWAAVSRAMRAPDRVEQDSTLNAFGFSDQFGFDWLFPLNGNPDVAPEWLTAYEAGYRTLVGSALTLDFAAYHNRYDGLITPVYEDLAPQVRMDSERFYFEFPAMYRNLLSVETTGGEAVAVYAPDGPWKVTTSYALFSYVPEFKPPAIDFGTDGGGAPRHQAQVRYSMQLPFAIDTDVALFAASAMPQPAFDVPARVRLDARIAWRPRSPLELSVVMQNLTGQDHPEHGTWSSGVLQPSRMRPSAYGSVSWTF